MMTQGGDNEETAKAIAYRELLTRVSEELMLGASIGLDLVAAVGRKPFRYLAKL